MPIFERNDLKILFIHIPKTGGTSIEEYLSKHFKMSFHSIGVPFPMKITPQHLQINDLKVILNGKSWDYAFSVVRNPYDRIISEYFYITEWTKNKWGRRPEFNMWIIENLNKLKNNPFHLDNHLRPQYEFIDGEIEIFKFEDGIEKIIKYLSDKFNLPLPSKRIHKNKSKKERVEFSLEALEKVNEIYKKDFELFGYNIKHKNLQLKKENG